MNWFNLCDFLNELINSIFIVISKVPCYFSLIDYLSAVITSEGIYGLKRKVV